MNPSRVLPIGVFLSGLLALVGAMACGGGGSSEKQTASPASAATEASPTATATNTATPTSTPTQTPTPTPTPYNGAVARIVYSRLGVNAPIENLALKNEDEMDTPHRTNTDVGWYCWQAAKTLPAMCDRPGWEGNAVFSAHIYYNNIPAPFQRLQQAADGDEIQVTMDNGASYKYVVFSRKTYNRDTIPTGDIVWPGTRPKGEQWITLISCGGQLDATGWEYLDRIVVVAKRVA